MGKKLTGEKEKVPNDLPIEKQVMKMSYQHIKTPDEVDDLPEHEAVVPGPEVLEEINSELSTDLEEKITLDEQEKELLPEKESGEKKERSTGSVEAVRDNESVEVPIEVIDTPKIIKEVDENEQDVTPISKDTKIINEVDEKEQ